MERQRVYPAGFLGVVVAFRSRFRIHRCGLVGTARLNSGPAPHPSPRDQCRAVAGRGFYIRCPAGDPGRRAVAAIHDLESPFVTMFSSRTCRGVGRQLRRGSPQRPRHGSGFSSTGQMLFGLADRHAQPPPTQSRRRARTALLLTAPLRPSLLCRSVGDWGVHLVTTVSSLLFMFV